MDNITFENQGFLYLLLIIPIMIAWYIFKKKNETATIQISSLNLLENIPHTYKYYLRYVKFSIRLIVIALIITALARPQTIDNWENAITEGIDIVLALDISSSMLAQDFKPDRLEASKDVAIEFISGRPQDRIGLVVFSGESFTQCPLTTDHAVLINLFKDIKQGIIEDGTAIGLGLANAVSRLKDSKSKSKVVILLTDGVNNKGEIDPITAAEIAERFNVRVYTVGVGRNGYAPYPVQTMFGVQYQNMEVKIDEKTLRQIADITEGKYFRATNNQKLKQIYKEIDKLEKSKVSVKKFSNRKEEFYKLIIIAAALLFFEILIGNTLLKSIP